MSDPRACVFGVWIPGDGYECGRMLESLWTSKEGAEIACAKSNEMERFLNERCGADTPDDSIRYVEKMPLDCLLQEPPHHGD